VSQSHGKNRAKNQRFLPDSADRAQKVIKNFAAPRSLSLKNRERIRELFKSAKRRSGSSLTVFYHISVSQDDDEKQPAKEFPAKWLVAIPKRTGNAVVRNKLRRVLRETIRLWPGRQKISGEVIVRYNAPFKSGKANAKATQVIATDKQALTYLRTELTELLETITKHVSGK